MLASELPFLKTLHPPQVATAHTFTGGRKKEKDQQRN